LAKNPNAMLAVLWAGFACGVLDITAALVVYGYFGAKPVRLLQGIASKVDCGYDRALIRTIRGVGYQIGGNGSRAKNELSPNH